MRPRRMRLGYTVRIKAVYVKAVASMRPRRMRLGYDHRIVLEAIGVPASMRPRRMRLGYLLSTNYEDGKMNYASMRPRRMRLGYRAAPDSAAPGKRPLQ